MKRFSGTDLEESVFEEFDDRLLVFFGDFLDFHFHRGDIFGDFLIRWTGNLIVYPSSLWIKEWVFVAGIQWPSLWPFWCSVKIQLNADRRVRICWAYAENYVYTWAHTLLMLAQ